MVNRQNTRHILRIFPIVALILFPVVLGREDVFVHLHSTLSSDVADKASVLVGRNTIRSNRIDSSLSRKKDLANTAVTRSVSYSEMAVAPSTVLASGAVLGESPVMIASSPAVSPGFGGGAAPVASILATIPASSTEPQLSLDLAPGKEVEDETCPLFQQGV